MDEFVSLREMIDKHTKEVEQLTREIQELKNLIKSEAYSQTINSNPISGAEVFNVLETWANRGEGD